MEMEKGIEKFYLENPDFNLDWYRDVIDYSPDVFNVIDQDGVILFTNSRSSDRTRDFFIGKTIYYFFLPEYYPIVKEKIALVFATGKNNHYELATDYFNHRRYYMTNLAPIKRGDKVVAIAMYIRDITELKTAQHQLNDLNEELEERVYQRTLALNEYAKRLELTEKLSIALRHARSIAEVLRLLGKQYQDTFGGDVAGVYEVKDQHLNLAVTISGEVNPPTVLTSFSDKFFFSLLNENQISITQVPEQKHPDCQFCEFIHKNQMRTLVLAPIRAESAMVGVIFLAFKQPTILSTDDEQLMRSFTEAGGNTIHRILVMNRLEETINNRENELAVIYDIMSIASEVVDLDELLYKVLDRVLSAVNCGIGIINLVEGDQITKNIKIPNELPEVFIAGVNLIKSRSFRLEKIFASGDIQFWKVPKTNLNCISALIRSKKKILGLISLVGECLSEEDQELMHLIGSIADEVGLAVESTRLRKQAQDNLIFEERQRLARDLHDSVSQSLYGLVLSADISKKLLKLKEFSTLESTINDIETFALQSLREMRLMLFELRPLAFESEGLAGALELRLNTVERRAGLNTSLDIQGEEYLHSPLDLEIYRITTEALNNALKHSNANQVHVSLFVDKENNQCELKVIDNGTGFDVQTKDSGGIGLQSMQERAARVGGQLIVETNESFGTMVRFISPLR